MEITELLTDILSLDTRPWRMPSESNIQQSIDGGTSMIPDKKVFFWYTDYPTDFNLDMKNKYS